MKRRGRKSAAQTPAPAKERVYGSKKNPAGSAASKSSASKIQLSQSIIKTLKDKVAKYNESHKKDVSLSTAKAVMRRGMGAYSKSHRPTITGGAPNSRQAWGFARVNKFLKKKSGEPVKKAYVQDDDLLAKGGLLASNGKKSNLTKEQYRLVRTPEFKAWFGDWENDPENASKIVDENGEPKVMYHGTLYDFNEFIPEDDSGFLTDRNIYFFTADLNVAKAFASIKKRGEDKDKKFRIINAFINSRKPFDPEANKKEFDILYKITKYKNLADWMPDNWQLLEDKKNVKKIKQLGYDSIITTETDSSLVFGKLSSSYKGKSLKNLGVFKSSQVKLADGVNKTFDSKNPDIRYDMGAELPVGRLAKGMNLYDIAKHHKTSVAELKKELELGVKTEMEHTYDKEIAKAIAYDHLFENPRYYSDLSELEMKAEARKLEDYYASGGQTGQSCKVVDQQGEALTDRESLEQMTQCLENLPQTKSMYFDPQKNDYTPERKKLHRQIILDFKKDLVCVESTNPIAILMGGSPASGKSTFLKKYAPYLLKSEILKVDADEIRAKLPEYEGFNASQTHLETKDIVNTLLSDRSIGIPCRFDVIYDGTMNSTKSYLPLINLLKSLGYKVFIVYIDKVPKDVVIRRSIERYKRSGRFVPLSVIDDFFEKGTEALDKLKGSVDGYMVIDGSDTEYKIIERGGMRLPKNRNYSKIGEPINVQESEIVREFKRGGEIDPDDPKIKNQVTHKSGAAGGLLVGKRHSEGGIKAINKSTGQPLEMEGGEVVITRDAVSDPTLVEFEGKKMTKRQVLSAINESGGGVSFAEGGDIPDKCSCSGKQYNYGGKVIKDVDIVNDIMSSHRKGFGIPYRDLPHSEAIKKMFEGYYPKMEEGGEVYEEGGQVTIINKRVPSYKSFAEKNKDVSQVALKRNYKDYLKSKYDLDFSDLPHSIQVALMLGNQKIVDNYLNS